MGIDDRGSAGIDAIVFDFDGTLAEPRLDFGEMKRRLYVLLIDSIRFTNRDPSARR